MFRRLSLVALSAAAVTASACNNDSQITASLYVTTDTLVAYTFTGTSPSLPTALASSFRTTIPVDGSSNYDLVFDINALDNTKIDLIPARKIVNPVAGSPSVGIETVDTPFDSVKVAPVMYYRPDTVTTVSVGQTILLQMHRSTSATICYYLSDPRIYAKVVIDSVNVTNRTIHLRQTVNPNCGYRSLIPGLPTG